MNTVITIIHNPSIPYSDVQFAVTILFYLITDLAEKHHPLRFIESGD